MTKRNPSAFQLFFLLALPLPMKKSERMRLKVSPWGDLFYVKSEISPRNCLRHAGFVRAQKYDPINNLVLQ